MLRNRRTTLFLTLVRHLLMSTSMVSEFSKPTICCAIVDLLGSPFFLPINFHDPLRSLSMQDSHGSLDILSPPFAGVLCLTGSSCSLMKATQPSISVPRSAPTLVACAHMAGDSKSLVILRYRRLVYSMFLSLTDSRREYLLSLYVKICVLGAKFTGSTAKHKRSLTEQVCYY